MKNRRSFIFWGVALFFAVMIFCPFKVLAEDVVTVPGIIEVEENHLYMVSIGTDDGVSKGDTVEITRDGQKIADARLISVLSDNSMAEIVVLFVRTDILESDSVKFFREEERKPRKRKTFGAGRTTDEKAITVVPVRGAEESRKGLLGSAMHRYEEVVAVEGPLQKEIEQLKAGLVSVRDEYEGKVDTILSSVGGKKDVLAVEKKWKAKLVSTEKRYQAQYRERKRLLERESTRLEARIAGLNNEMKIVNEGTDRRIRQLLSDLKEKGDEISSLKQTFVEEHLAGERQWKAKLENLEAQYQNQLRTQKEGLEKEFATEREKLQNDVNYLTEQVELVKESTGNQNNEMQVRLKEREDFIDALRKEQIILESDLSRESKQVRKLESDAVILKDVIGATKRVHAKELEISRKPLETRIEDMSVEFISTKHDYERKLNALRQGSKEELLENESQWVEKLASVEKKYQDELGQLNSQSAAQINQLRAELEGQKDVIGLLKQNQVELTSKLKASEQQFAQSQSDRNASENQLSVEKATRQEKINFAKQPLEEKVAELSAELVSVKAKKGEDESLIEFLNNAMADLAADLEDRDQKIIKFEESLTLSKGEIEAMKKLHVERLDLAKEPLEAEIKSLNEEIVLLRRNYEDQIKGVQENASRNLLTSEEQWQAKFTALEKEYQKELDVTKQDVAGQMNVLEQKIAVLNKEHEAELKTFQENADKERSAVEQQWQARLNEAESGYQKTLDEELGKNQRVIDFLKEEKSDVIARMAGIQKEYESKIGEMEVVAEKGQKAVNEQWQAKLEDHQAQVKRIEQSSQQDQTVKNEQWQAKLAGMEDNHRKQLDRVSSEKEKVVSKLESEKTDLAKQITALQKDHQAQVKRIEQSSQQDQTVKNEQWQARMNEKERMISLLEDGKERLVAEKASLKKDHETEIERIQDNSQKNQTAYEKQWQSKIDSQERFLEGEIAGLNEHLNSLKKDSNSVIDDLQAQLQKRQGEANSLTKDKFQLTESLFQKTNQLVRAEDEIVVLKGQVKETQSSRAKWITSVKKPLEEEIKNRNNEIISLKKDHERKIVALEKSSGKYRSDLEKQWQTKLAAQKEEFQKKINEQEKSSEERMTSLRQQRDLAGNNSSSTIKDLRSQLEDRRQLVGSLEKRVSDLASTLGKRDKRIADLDGNVVQLGKELKAASFSYADQVKIAKQPMEEKIKTLNRELESLWDEAKKELKAAEGQWEDKLEAAGKDRKEEVDRLQKQLEKMKGSRTNDIRQAKNPLEDKIKTLNRELESLWDEAKVELKEAEKQWEDKLEVKDKEIKSLWGEAKKELAIAEDEWRVKLNKKDKTIARLRKKPEAEWKAKFAENDEQWSERFSIAEENYQKELKGKEENLQTQIAELNRQLNLLKGDSNGVIDQMRSDLKNKQNSISALEKEKYEFRASLDRKDSELVKLRSELSGLKEDLRESNSRRSKIVKSAREPLETEIRALERELSTVKSDYEYKIKTEGPREVAALKDQMRELKGANNRQLELLKNELEIERRVVADLEREKADLRAEFGGESSREKRLELAKSSLDAEIKKLNSEMAFMKDDYRRKAEFSRQQTQDDLRSSEEKWQAQLAASEARWKTKWAVREAEHQQETAAEMESLEKRIFGGKKEVQETIVSLNNRFNMLKDGSDSQIRELEMDLAAQQYQLTVREAEFQERLMEVDQQWSNKLELAQKRHQGEMGKQKRVITQDFLDEKKELRETVVDLTRQFNELRDSSRDRIRDLEGDVERKDYKLSLLENRSQQDLLGTEEKWQAKSAATEEKRQRELMEQKQELEEQFLAGKKRLQETIGDLNRQINSLRDQFRLDLALREEESMAEIALLERKYQDQLSGLKKGSSDQVDELVSKTKRQQDLIDSLESKNSNLEFDLDQRERELARLGAEADGLKKETKMAELSQSEKLRLSKRSLEAKIDELSSQLAITKKKTTQEREELEDRWKGKLEKTEEDYIQKIKLQRQNLEEEALALDNKISMLENDRGNTIKEMQIELEDDQTLIRLLSKEKYELASGLEEKSRMIVMLNEEIIDLKEDLETYKDMLPLSSSSRLDSADEINSQALASEDQAWYDSQNALSEDYYATIRAAILSKFTEFDFSDYEGKEGVVKIDFELLANGSPKKKPEFLGTQDQGLKDLLTRCFQDALPFPPFPEALGKESQRFSLGISFKKQ